MKLLRVERSLPYTPSAPTSAAFLWHEPSVLDQSNIYPHPTPRHWPRHVRLSEGSSATGYSQRPDTGMPRLRLLYVLYACSGSRATLISDGQIMAWQNKFLCSHSCLGLVLLSLSLSLRKGLCASGGVCVPSCVCACLRLCLCPLLIPFPNTSV